MKEIIKSTAKFAIYVFIGVIGLNCVSFKVKIVMPERMMIEHRLDCRGNTLKLDHTVGYSGAQIHIDHTGFIR